MITGKVDLGIGLGRQRQRRQRQRRQRRQRLPNWRPLQGPETDIFADLEEAVNTLVGDPEITRYTLLVSPDGLFYDTNRLGGDHHIRTKSGRRFILSVRRGVRNDDKILLAIAY